MCKGKRMKKVIVKLNSIKLNNFKNIEKSEIVFSDKSEIINTVGIYGQNGSGKTAVIEAINVLKSLLIEASLPVDIDYFINCQSDSFALEYKFILTREELFYIVKYYVKIFKNNKNEVYIQREKIDIFDEDNKLLGYVDFNNSFKKHPIKSEDLTVNNSTNVITDSMAIAASQISIKMRKTVLFQDIIREDIKKSNLIKNILSGLSYYGVTNLFVVGMKETSLISAVDSIFLNIRSDVDDNVTSGKLGLNLSKPTELPSALLKCVTPALEQINEVMSKLIPNFKIEFKKINEEYDKNNQLVSTIQLFSKINDDVIPFKYESEGIKKLVSLCSAMISMYNNETVCLVVDELDSGVFEYLLGALVKILHRGGKGQLIFTSHNLRLLETLPKHCIVFSTTNSKRRFVRMANVKPNNNLRDFYLRTILLGGQKEELYDETDEFKIERAFRKCQNH